MFPPSLSLVYQPDENLSDNASNDDSNKSKAKCLDACRKVVMNGEHRSEVFIEAWIPIGGDKYDTCMCMGDVEKPNYDSSTPANRPGKVAEVLQRGKAAGGRPRRLCTGPRGLLEGALEAEYDGVDELLRRLKIASAQTSKFLDEELITSIVGQYLEDVHDSTLGRYS